MWKVIQRETNKFRTGKEFMMSLNKILMWIFFFSPVGSLAQVRLAGGSETAGRVEVFLNGEWGTVCDDNWDILDATVVCRQLGFPAAMDALTKFDLGQGRIHLDEVTCNGDEMSLLDCPRSDLTHDCSHAEDVGIVCLPVRLVGGNRTAGRVEAYIYGQWGTVCDDYWDLRDATVVCHQLGFPTASQALGYATFGEGTGPIHFDDVYCYGDEASLSDCYFTSRHNCHHSEDAGVSCLPYVRLAGGNRTAGRVEIFLNGQWGTVCDDLWNLRDATVVCRQLGFKEAYRALRYATFGEGTGPIYFDDVECDGNETSLLDCSLTLQHNCDHSEDVGVSCLPYDNYAVRLAGGNSVTGRVEVFLNGEWGTVCDDSWDILDAYVVCHQLGFNVAYRALSSFGGGTGPIHFDDVECTGDEISLADCSFTSQHDCGHNKDAGVYCLPNYVHTTPQTGLYESSSSSVTQKIDSCSSMGSVRLRGGNKTSGRVEICLNEQWGTVCDDGWDLEDAEVVCRELGYKKASTALLEVYLGEGHGPIHLDESRCLGNETSLLSCNHSRLENCQHKEDASVSCVPFEKGEVRLVNGNVSAGRVEVYFDGQWGTVCDDDWGLDEANVVCRKIGFKRALSALKNAAFGEGEGFIHLHEVKCTGDEHSLLACEYKRYSTCEHREDASVVCQTLNDEDLLLLSEGEGNAEMTSMSWVVPVLSVCLFAALISSITATTLYCVSRRNRERQEELREEKDVSILRPLPDTPTAAPGLFVDMVRLERGKAPEKENKKTIGASGGSTRTRSSETNIYMSVIEDNNDFENYEVPVGKLLENKISVEATSEIMKE